MGEGTIAPEIEKKAQEFKAGKTGDEAWAERALAQRAVEREAAEPEGGKERAQEEAPAGEAPPKVSFLKEFMRSRKIEEEIRQEAADKEPFKARFVGGEVAQIPPELAGTPLPVKLEFQKKPEEGTLLYLEKREVYIFEEPGSKPGTIGFGKFFRAELPRDLKGEVPKWVNPEDVYLQPVRVPEEELNALKKEAADMRAYLTADTLDKLGIQKTEAQPEARELARAA